MCLKLSSTEIIYYLGKNKVKIENKFPVDRIKGNKVVGGYYTKLYNELNNYQEYNDWTRHVQETNDKNREEYKNIQNIDFDFKDLKRIIRKLKNNKATGTDGITNEILKILNDDNLRTFLDIMNRLYRNNLVPESWNTGMVTTLYKGSGSKGDPSKYKLWLKNPCKMTMI